MRRVPRPPWGWAAAGQPCEGGHELMDDRHGAGSSRRSYRGRLAVVLVATCTILGLEVVGALVSGSLVLLAEAGRTATDAAGIGLLLLLLWLVARPATPEQAFGYYQLQLLAACVSAVLLFGVASPWPGRAPQRRCRLA